MWFKNLLAFRLDDNQALDLDTLAERLEPARLADCPPTAQSTEGFVSPYPIGHTTLTHVSSGAVLLEYGVAERMLPSSVVREALRARIENYRARLQRTPGKRVREMLKDEVLNELLPKAFVRQKRVAAYIDTVLGLLIVDTTSQKIGDAIVKALRTVVTEFHAQPLACEESTGSTMTGWLLDDKCAAGFVLGDGCQLKDPLDTRAVVKVAKHDLGLEEIREHARQGKRVAQLALRFDNRLSFVLTETLVLRKLKFLDLIQEELGDISGDDAIAEIDARFTLMVLELRRLYGALDAVLKLV